jgi:hypothetical protein
MEAKTMELKLELENPSEVSMGDQSLKDSIVIRFPKDLVLTDTEGNSLVIDNAEDTEGYFGLEILI